MTAVDSTDPRHVVPRWRSVRKTVEAGEFQRLAVPRPLPDSHRRELERYALNWAVEPSLISASEFVGASRIAGEFGPAAEGAARHLQRHAGNSVLRTLGGAGNTSTSNADVEAADSSRDPLYDRISGLKKLIRNDPRDPIAWADLARAHTSLANFTHAEHALRIARLLAPGSRYLLRVTSRFYVHIDEPDRAFRLLRSSPRTTQDPWLMAALLSVASLAEIPVTGMKAARRIADDDAFRPIERADLESEIGTLELQSGSDKRARTSLRRSLESPTDNSLAQAQWASFRMANFEVHPDDVKVPFKAEAEARAAAERGDWAESYAYAVEWLDDQPFDTDAASLASYVSAIGLEDWAASAAAARRGLRARPGDLLLTNNLAYSLIEGGRLDEADRALASLRLTSEAERSFVPLVATIGLLHYRRGDRTLGSDEYERAIRLARRTGQAKLEAVARTMKLSEDLRDAPADEQPTIALKMLELANSSRDPAVAQIVKRAGLYLGQKATSR